MDEAIAFPMDAAIAIPRDAATAFPMDEATAFPRAAITAFPMVAATAFPLDAAIAIPMDADTDYFYGSFTTPANHIMPFRSATANANGRSKTILTILFSDPSAAASSINTQDAPVIPSSSAATRVA